MSKTTKTLILRTMRFAMLINLGLYTSAYLAQSFILWELRHPLYWFMLIPTIEPGQRFMVLFFYVVAQIAVYKLVYSHLLELQAKKNRKYPPFFADAFIRAAISHMAKSSSNRPIEPINNESTNK